MNNVPVEYGTRVLQAVSTGGWSPVGTDRALANSNLCITRPTISYLGAG